MHNPFDQLLINAQNEHDLALAEGRAFAVVDIDAIRDEFAIAWDAAARENYCGSETGWAGSAVVAITPRHKGNTRLGKRERAALTALGATYASSARAFWLSAPSGTCSVQTKCAEVWEEAAKAGADVLRKYGFDAHVHSWPRMGRL
jgi:hypothetical protein